MRKHKCMVWCLVAMMLLGMLLIQGCSQPTAPAKEIKQVFLSSTIGPIDAGIIGALEDAYEQKTGVRVRHVGAGTAQALKIGESGSVDLIVVHAKSLEEKFVADGFGTERIDFMYNDFVIVGPADDPAGIKGEKSATAALKKIAESKSLFISRGDKSGTNVKEIEVWDAAGIKPVGDWYRIYEKGASGNVPTLLYTDEQRAYTLIDRATYITTKDKIKLEVLVENDELLLNYITLIPVNPAKFPDINAEGANDFIAWLVSAEGQQIVKEFGKDKYGEPLFFPNSPEGKKL
ncbi:MAG: substrate-binding domain-containing protein [Syntrophomonadaceae bacterium]